MFALLDVGKWAHGRNPGPGWMFYCEICFEKKRKESVLAVSTPKKNLNDVSTAFNTALQTTPMKTERVFPSISSPQDMKKSVCEVRWKEKVCFSCGRRLAPGNEVWGWKEAETNLWFCECYPSCSTTTSEDTPCKFRNSEEFVSKTEAKETGVYAGYEFIHFFGYEDDKPYCGRVEENNETNSEESEEEHDYDFEEKDEKKNCIDDAEDKKEKEKEKKEDSNDPVGEEVVVVHKRVVREETDDDTNSDDGLGRAFDDNYVPKAKKPRKLKRLKKGK
jgi:hypothetical protein